MKVLKTSIKGVVIIEPDLFKDSRGYFFESFNQKEFKEKVCETLFVQENKRTKTCMLLINRTI